MALNQQSFEANVRYESRTAVIDLKGEINAFAEASLNAAFSEAISQQPASVMLNFGEVDYINSTGIALIVGLLAEARKEHLPLIAYGLSDHYIEIFNITRLSDFMTLAIDEESAKEAA